MLIIDLSFRFSDRLLFLFVKLGPECVMGELIN